jgi:predicted aconitase
MALELTADDHAALSGDRGEAERLAMRLVIGMADVMGASRLLDIEGAHIDGCLYHGRAGLDFARRLLDGGGRVAVPTTLNVSSLDLLHPGLVRLEQETAEAARALMDAYVAMGCRPTWTCAPYQLRIRPDLGAHVAWGESNAIVFCNSVLGARTERYGDFIDICCAITGRAPAAGLYLDEGRLARAVFRVDRIPRRLLEDPAGFAAIGHVVGEATGTLLPAVTGLPRELTTEDHLKALCAAAASSGSVAMFHAVGITPEASTLDVATGGLPPQIDVTLTAEDLRNAVDELGSVAPGAAIGAVSVGTPHCSVAEFERLGALVGGDALRVPFYVNTGRDVLAEAGRLGLLEPLRAAGVTIVTDTCTYITPVIRNTDGPVMTNSAKWAWYAPANLGLAVAFGTLDECVRSAVQGRLVRDDGTWDG